MEPANPYAAAKVFVHHLVRLYRTHYGLFACSGILYNHESPKRPGHFVTAKVVRAALAIKAGKEKELQLGDLDIARDWGYAGDYAEAMWLMLQQPEADDFIIGTGKLHTVRDLCRFAFSELGLDYEKCVAHSSVCAARPSPPSPLFQPRTNAKNMQQPERAGRRSSQRRSAWLSCALSNRSRPLCRGPGESDSKSIL